MVDKLTILAPIIEMINSKYFPLGGFNIPVNMDEDWNRVTEEWPDELLDSADATIDGNDIIVRPYIYNNLLSDDTYKFNSAIGTFIHELLHMAIRMGGTTSRKEKIKNDIKDDYREGRIHLYFEEAAAELITIYIMVNEYGVEDYISNYKISYEPAVYVLAEWALVLRPDNPLQHVKNIFVINNSSLLQKNSEWIDNRRGNITINELLGQDWLVDFIFGFEPKDKYSIGTKLNSKAL